MQAPKNGFFYVLDRITGELLAADPYTKITWAEGVDLKTGRPIETDNSDYSISPKEIKPGPHGGHNWQAMSYNPNRKLVYIPTIESSMIYKDDPNWEYKSGFWNVAVDFDTDNPGNLHLPQGGLIAWDPIKRKRVWGVNHINEYNGGTLATAGDLIFQGTGEAYFIAYDAKSGNKLWSYFTGTAIIAPPVTYHVNGQQYVSVLAGWGGSHGLRNPPSGKAAKYFQEGILYTFSLGSKVRQPELVKHPRTKLTGPQINIKLNQEYATKGESLYKKNCSTCHGPIDGKAGIIPDLATTPPEMHQIWHQIVSDGILAASRGMPGFKDRLTNKEISFIQHFVTEESISLAKENKENN